MRSASEAIVCSWIKDHNNAPTRMENIVIECWDLRLKWDWSVKVIPRCANGTADRLAKSGINRSDELFYSKVESEVCKQG